MVDAQGGLPRLVGPFVHDRARKDSLGADRRVDGCPAVRGQGIAKRARLVVKLIASRLSPSVARVGVPAVGKTLVEYDLDSVELARGKLVVRVRESLVTGTIQCEHIIDEVAPAPVDPRQRDADGV